MKDEERLDFEWLFRASYPSVARTAFLVVRDRVLAEDIAQEAFEKLWQHWSSISQYERPEAWVRRVAIRAAVRQSRRDQRRSALERVDPQVEDAAQPDVDVHRAISALAPMQRAAVVLYYLEDQPVAEIARTLQVSASTVKQHLFRARSRLADLLHEEVTEDVR